jgi:putative endonuclease
MSREKGFAAERWAQAYLVRHGLVCLAQQYRTRYGEIDLIMQDSWDQEIVFVEVKYRKDRGFGAPYETVSAQKQRKLYLAATHFLTYRLKNPTLSARFDVMSLCAHPAEIHWIKHAFEVN